MAPEVGLEPRTLRLTVARNQFLPITAVATGVLEPLCLREICASCHYSLWLRMAAQSPRYFPQLWRSSLFPNHPAAIQPLGHQGLITQLLRTGRCTHRFTRPQNGQVSRDAFAVSNSPRRHQEPFRPRASDAVELSVGESCGCTQQYRLDSRDVRR